MEPIQASASTTLAADRAPVTPSGRDVRALADHPAPDPHPAGTDHTDQPLHLRHRQQRFAELFDAHHSEVLAYARRRLGQEADDAVADTFLLAWRKLDGLTGDPRLWLYGLARGAVSHHRRRLGRIERLGRRTAAMDLRIPVPDPAESAGWVDRFAAAFAGLSEADREVLRLTAWEHLGPAEGSVVLGCSVAAFKVRLHRARRRLRAALEADHPDRAPAGAASASPPRAPVTVFVPRTHPLVPKELP